MKIQEIILEKKTGILNKWWELILATYPADTTNFLKREKDRFANPVGHTIFQEIHTLFENILGEGDTEIIAASLDKIIRIRSVQDFPASESAGFILLLKQAVREELIPEISEKSALKELLQFESKIDKIVQVAFDIYTGCREQIHDLRVREIKNEKEMVLRVLERASKYENPDSE